MTHAFFNWLKQLKRHEHTVIGIWFIFALWSVYRTVEVFIGTVSTTYEAIGAGIGLELLIIAGFAGLSWVTRKAYRKHLQGKSVMVDVVGGVAATLLCFTGAGVQIGTAELAADKVSMISPIFWWIYLLGQLGQVFILILLYCFDIGDYVEEEHDKWSYEQDEIKRELYEQERAKIREEQAEEEKRSTLYVRCVYCGSYKLRRNIRRHMDSCKRFTEQLPD